jgi:hypothetical protein
VQVRSLLMIAAAFALAFFGGRWLMGPSALKGDPRVPTFAQAVQKLEAESRRQGGPESDGDPERDRLRSALIETATAFQLSPCNADLKQRYLDAATAYARAYLKALGCSRFPACGASMQRIDAVSAMFSFPLDKRARELVGYIHDMGISHQDYPDDNVGYLIGSLGHRNFAREGEWSCTATRSWTPK